MLRSLVLCLSFACFATTSIAKATCISLAPMDSVNLTLYPDTERQRAVVSESARLLADKLAEKISVLTIAHKKWLELDSGKGKLYQNPEFAAEHAKQQGCQWLLIPRIYTPTHLFAYFQVRLYNVSKQASAGEDSIEFKGRSPKLIDRTVSRMAEHVIAAIDSAQ